MESEEIDAALEHARALAARHGFLGVELHALARQALHASDDPSPERLEEAKRALRDVGTRLPASAEGIGDGVALLSLLARANAALGGTEEARAWRARARALAEARLAEARTDEARARLATTPALREALESRPIS